MYIIRQQVEIDSGIYDVNSDDSDTWSNGSLGAESEADFNDWLYDYGRELWILKLAMAILMALIQYGIIIMLFLIQYQSEGSRADAIIYESLLPMIRVLTITMAILGLISGVLWTIFTHPRFSR